MPWEEQWKNMTTAFGRGAKIPVLWGMLALLEICPEKNVKVQMLMRLDEIRENNENLKMKVI